MRRFDWDHGCMTQASYGDYVEHADHAAEVRQTQRRMIAALYWRAGVAAHLADVSCVFGEQRGYTSMRNALIFAARAMEAACPR